MANGRLEVVNTGSSVFIGEGAGANDDFVNRRNVAIGYSALFSNTTGSYNVANGYEALYGNTTGGDNVAIGGSALYFNTTGELNVAIGSIALLHNTTGTENVAIGDNALVSNTTGGSNVAIGSEALDDNTTGHYNVGNGFQALASNTTGSRNTAVGYNANVSTGNLTNATAIGANAIVSQDNSLVLGNAANVGIGTSAPTNKLDVDGSIRMRTAGATDGFIPVSNADGVMTWTDPAIYTAGDHLGNHTATQALDLSSNNIINGGTITATSFVGDGSGLTNIAHDNLGNHTATQNLKLSDNWVSNDGDSEGVFVSTTGNVGIGTSAPLYDLDVKGEIRLLQGTKDVVFSSGNFGNGNSTDLFFNKSDAGFNQSEFVMYNQNNNISSNRYFRLFFKADSASIGGLFVRKGGNVGIGLELPTNKLDVNGSIRMREGAAAGYIPVSDADGVMTWTDPAIYTVGDHLGNHTATQNLKLSGQWLSNDGGNEGVRVLNNGNVGVGLNDPAQELEVGGNFGLRSDDPQIVFYEPGSDGDRYSSIRTTMESHLYTGNPSELQNMAFYVSSGTSGQTNVMNLRGNGHVGIGTSTPQAKVEIKDVIPEIRLTDLRGTIGAVDLGKISWFSSDGSMSNDYGSVAELVVISENTTASPDGGFLFRTAQNDAVSTGLETAMVITSTNRVGIGTTSPDYLLEVNGSAGKPGGGSWTNSSDRRLKQNVKDYSGGLKEVLAINPVTFNYNKLSGFDTQPEYVGVIAQELLEIAPYMVSSYKKDDEDFLNVNPSALSFMLINAVKEQQEVIEAQQTEIEALKAKADEVDVLKAEIESIKAMLRTGAGLENDK
ncbi:MAG: hypothetical protein GY834_14015 [Bacteroidetes bacterium]|nr:hypothetical protein [Bacteroidota bacterium]